MGKSLVIVLSLVIVSIPASAVTVSSAVSLVLADVVDENQPDLQRNFKKYLCRKGRSFNGLACSNETMAALTLAVCTGKNPGQDPKGSEFKTSQCFTKAKTKLKIKGDAKIAETAKRVLKEQGEKHDQLLEKLCPYLPDDVAEYACDGADNHATDDEQESEEAEEPEEE